MIFYQYTYSIDKEISKIFAYFVDKKYLTRFFKPNDAKLVEVISKNINETNLNDSDLIKIRFNDPENNIVLIDQIRVKENSSIKMKMTFSTEDNTINGDSKHGFSFEYNLTLQKSDDHIKVIEKSEVNGLNLFEKIVWKTIGAYYKLTQLKTHKQVERELELL